jgi:hypothetical protein
LGKLRDSSNKSVSRGILNALWSELLDVDENYAETYLRWCLNKLKINKQHQEELRLKRERNNATTEDKKKELTLKIKAISHKNLPKNISKGDIVHVNFGINLGDELSDIDYNNKPLTGHYGIVLGQKGFMFLIVPITSQAQRVEPKMTLKDLGLPGTTTESHVAFAKMRCVHIRRIQRIHSLPEGKKTLSPELLKELEEKVLEFWSLNPPKVDILLTEA